MQVSKDTLLLELPPYRDEWVVRKKHQQVRDIIRWTIDAYPRFAGDYDRIGLFFLGRTVSETCDNLYKFCLQNVQYVEEGVEWQSIERPAGILIRGICDCKGYANFIGGCLGAINRQSDANIDWSFCFASYKVEERTPYHVFIIVRTEQGEIWIDPTPGANDMTPVWVLHEKITEQMPLMENIGSLMENVGRVSATGELYYEPTAVGATVATGDPQTDAAVNSVNAFIQSLPDGALKTSLNKSMSGALPIIATWIAGRTYTSGDYKLGEIFLNRVMGKSTSNWRDTPDQVVPIAWMYFSTLFGLPIAVNTDFDSIQNGTLQAYLNGRPEQAGHVTQEQVTRANQLFNLPAMRPQKQTVPLWPPTAFDLLPYVAPIPDPRVPGMPFTGTLPNGQNIVNGLPAAAAPVGQGVLVPGGPTMAPATTASAFGNNTWLWIAAAVVGVILLTEKD
jgi:hypothetical protein